MSLSKWDRRFIDLALHVAQWSKDTSTKVGCVLVDSHQRIISLGFNGPPRGVSDHHITREEKISRTLHAEDNALLFAARSVEGATAYVTHPTCSNCAARLVQMGVARVVFPKPSEDFMSRWKESYYIAKKMFSDAGVEVYEEEIE